MRRVDLVSVEHYDDAVPQSLARDNPAPGPPLSGDVTCDVVVVGAGCTGSSGAARTITAALEVLDKRTDRKAEHR